MKINNMSGKLSEVPMKPKGDFVKAPIKTNSGNPQKAALVRTITEATPHIPPGGKVNVDA